MTDQPSEGLKEFVENLIEPYCDHGWIMLPKHMQEFAQAVDLRARKEVLGKIKIVIEGEWQHFREMLVDVIEEDIQKIINQELAKINGES